MFISRKSYFVAAIALSAIFTIPTLAADAPSIPMITTDLFATMRLPSNIIIYNIIMREFTGTTTEENKGVYQTCDSGEIAMGGFCQQIKNGDTGGLPNALLSSGVATLRSVICQWKNKGIYRVVATCVSVRGQVGDPKSNIYDPDQPGDVK